MIASEGQNIFDACLQGYGDLELIFDLIEDNELTINSELGAGQEIIIDDTKGNNQIKEYILINSIEINNRTYTDELSIEETTAIQWEIFVDPLEIVYPYKLIAP